MIYKLLLVLAGWVFYIVVSPPSIVYLLTITLVTYLIGIKLEELTHKSPKSAKLLLGLTVVALLAVLVWFKYSYIVTGISPMIPLGLSYYTFMVIGYLTDIYRTKIEAEKDIADYALFMGFFPQVTAGPIGRADKLLPQYKRKIKTSPEHMLGGFMMIIIGVMQKFIIADNLRLIVDDLMSDRLETLSVSVAMLIYSLVIYYDFAGYSLIAIGVARVFGIRLMDNFKSPYLATSVKDFWRRWHISLSSWFRDYLYIPLGGNKKSPLRRDINTLIVFILSGAWHGSMIGFWIWGFIHGIYLVLENHIRNIISKNHRTNTSQGLAIAIMKKIAVYVLVSVAWVPFYAGKLWKIRDVIKGIINPNIDRFATCVADEFGVHKGSLVIVAVCLVISIALSIYQERNKYRFYDVIAGHGVCVLMSAIAVFVLTLLVGVYGSGYDASVFIYGGF